MTARNVVVVNPLATDVTVGANTAKARSINKFSVDDAVASPAPSVSFIDAGCCVISDAAITGSSVETREAAGFILERLVQFNT